MPRISCGLWALSLSLTGVRAETTLDLPYCLNEAMGHNHALLQAREAIHQIEGSRIVVHSRFMPYLDLTASYDAQRICLPDGKTENQLGSALRFSQRLFEFGPHFAQEVQIREELRQAVYAYESLVYQELTRVWALFHLIRLQDRQLAIRSASRDDFHSPRHRQARGPRLQPLPRNQSRRGAPTPRRVPQPWHRRRAKHQGRARRAVRVARGGRAGADQDAPPKRVRPGPHRGPPADIAIGDYEIGIEAQGQVGTENN